MIRIIAAITALLFPLISPAQAIDLTPDQQEEVKLKSGKWFENRQLAEELIKASKYTEAEFIYKYILKQRQALALDLLSEYNDLAQLYIKWGKKDAAEKAYQDMVSAREKLNGADDPQVMYALNLYADFLNKNDQKQKAQAARTRARSIQKQIDTIPNFPAITAKAGSAERIAEANKMRTIGEKLTSSDLHRNALAYFNRAIQLNPNDARAFYDRGDSQHFLERFSKASADYDKAIKLKPDYAKAYIGRAFIHENLNQNRLAIADFKKAIILDPKNTDAIGDLSKLLDNMGKHQEAVIGFTKAISVNPKLYWPYIQRAESHLALKQYKAAITDYTVLVERAPTDPDFREYRAAVYMKCDDLQNALLDYDALIQYNPKYSIGYRVRAKIYEKLDGKKTPRVLADYAMAKKLGYAN